VLQFIIKADWCRNRHIYTRLLDRFRRGGIAPFALNLYIIEVIGSFKSRLHRSLDSKLGGLKLSSGRFCEDKDLLVMSKIETLFHGYIACSLVEVALVF